MFYVESLKYPHLKTKKVKMSRIRYPCLGIGTFILSAFAADNAGPEDSSILCLLLVR